MITSYHQMTSIVYCRQKFICVSVWVCMYVSMCVYIYICVYMYALLWKLVIKCYQWTLQANNYKWILVTQSSTKQNKKQQKMKQPNNQTKKCFQWQVVEPDQFCWGARAKMTLLKSTKKLLSSSTDETCHLSHCI